MTVKRLKLAKAVSLVELIIAILILGVLVVCALNDQYYAAMHARIARAQTTASQTARLLLEDWTSTGGSNSYDPSALGLGISSSAQIPDDWAVGHSEGMGTPLNNTVYAVTIDGLPMIVMLRSQNIEEDVSAKVILLQLTVIIGFGEVQADGSVTFPDRFLERIPDVTLSTYTRIDAG
jgi:Tfp pilus assembly protein PilE